MRPIPRRQASSSRPVAGPSWAARPRACAFRRFRLSRSALASRAARCSAAEDGRAGGWEGDLEGGWDDDLAMTATAAPAMSGRPRAADSCRSIPAGPRFRQHDPTPGLPATRFRQMRSPATALRCGHRRNHPRRNPSQVAGVRPRWRDTPFRERPGRPLLSRIAIFAPSGGIGARHPAGDRLCGAGRWAGPAVLQSAHSRMLP